MCMFIREGAHLGHRLFRGPMHFKSHPEHRIFCFVLIFLSSKFTYICVWIFCEYVRVIGTNFSEHMQKRRYVVIAQTNDNYCSVYIMLMYMYICKNHVHTYTYEYLKNTTFIYSSTTFIHIYIHICMYVFCAQQSKHSDVLKYSIFYAINIQETIPIPLKIFFWFGACHCRYLYHFVCIVFMCM